MVTTINAFSGGTDPQPYTAVAQSDITTAANSLISANQPDPQQVVQGQLQTNERLIGTPHCMPNVSANHRAGDQATTVTVTVTFTCTGVAYDQDGALALGAKLLSDQAATDPGPGYALVGQIKTALVNATLADAQQGTVTLTVSAEGIWVYQFSATQQQALATLLAGKTQQEATDLLLQQTGVATATVEIVGGNGQTLPTDPQKIKILVQAVAGL